MKFLIERTSLSVWHNQPPCEEAKQEMFPKWQTRTCSEAEFNEKFSHREGLWREHGADHKEFTPWGKAIYVTRRVKDEPRWVIELNTLEDLIRFQGKYERLVINSEDIGDPTNPIEMPTIEIYDDYRE